MSASLKLHSFDTLMQVSLCAIELEYRNWRATFELWPNLNIARSSNFSIFIYERI